MPMGRLRFALAGPIRTLFLLVGTSLVTFGLAQLHPGAPAAGAEPVHLRYLQFLRGLAGGDLGQSAVYKLPLSDVLMSSSLHTILLVLGSGILGTLLAILLARLAAASDGGVLDRLTRLYTALGRSTPTFWLALMLAAGLGILLPAAGSGPASLAAERTLPRLALAAVTLALLLAPRAIRRLRSGLQQERFADHVAAARSRGLPEGLIHRRHVFRNSLIPAAGRIGANLGLLLGATVAVEKALGLPGLGRLLVDSILLQDYSAAELAAWIFAIALILLRLVTEAVARSLDPRGVG